jgi:hypothetical protein
MMPMINDTERKDFEASMIQLFGYEADEFYFTDGEYIDPDLNDLYLTWQAALAQREQEAPSLCTAEEAAELARTVAPSDCGEYGGLINYYQLAAIINADRAKR